jgi:gamma-glutamylcyclotransferase (GGCT)/AIG2-like uncharacterized protein YtfP
MCLFLYGSLLDERALTRHAGNPSLPGRLEPATIAGFTRLPARSGRFPTLARARGASVNGAVLPVTAAALGRLRAYEGADYHLVRVRAAGRHGPVPAYAFIAPPRAHGVFHKGRSPCINRRPQRPERGKKRSIRPPC